MEKIVRTFLICCILSGFSGFAQAGPIQTDSAKYYISKSQYPKAQEYSKRFCAAALERNDYVTYCRGLIRYADIFVLLNDKRRAQEILFAGLKVVEKQNDPGLRALILNKIGMVYAQAKDNPKSLIYFRSAWKLAVEVGNDTLLRKCEQSMFRSYTFNKKKDSARYFINRILDRARKSKDPNQLQNAHTNGFVFFYYEKDWPQTEKFLDSALYYAFKTKDNKQMSAALTNQAAFFMKPRRNYKAAKENYDAFFKLRPNDTTSFDMGDYYYTYADILEHLGMYKESVWYLNRAIAIRDASYAEGKNQLIWEMEGKYNIDKLEDGFNEKQKRTNLVMIIMLAVLVLIIILFYFYNQTNKLKQKNRVQELQNDAQQQILGATLDGQESERHKIAGVLHDNISAMLSSASMQLQVFAMTNPGNSEGLSKTREILSMAHNSVRELSHELVPVLLTKFGMEYAISDLCERNSTNSLLIESDFKLENERFDSEFETKIFFIASELLNNIVKHSGASKVSVKLSSNEETLTLLVSDNGKGFDAKKGDGFGLTQIKARVRTMNGTAKFDSKTGHGTTVVVTLPLPDSNALA